MASWQSADGRAFSRTCLQQERQCGCRQRRGRRRRRGGRLAASGGGGGLGGGRGRGRRGAAATLAGRLGSQLVGELEEAGVVAAWAARERKGTRDAVRGRPTPRGPASRRRVPPHRAYHASRRRSSLRLPAGTCRPLRLSAQQLRTQSLTGLVQWECSLPAATLARVPSKPPLPIHSRAATGHAWRARSPVGPVEVLAAVAGR